MLSERYFVAKINLWGPTRSMASCFVKTLGLIRNNRVTRTPAVCVGPNHKIFCPKLNSSEGNYRRFTNSLLIQLKKKGLLAQFNFETVFVMLQNAKIIFRSTSYTRISKISVRTSQYLKLVYLKNVYNVKTLVNIVCYLYAYREFRYKTQIIRRQYSRKIGIASKERWFLSKIST